MLSFSILDNDHICVGREGRRDFLGSLLSLIHSVPNTHFQNYGIFNFQEHCTATDPQPSSSFTSVCCCSVVSHISAPFQTIIDCTMFSWQVPKHVAAGLHGSWMQQSLSDERITIGTNDFACSHSWSWSSGLLHHKLNLITPKYNEKIEVR